MLNLLQMTLPEINYALLLPLIVVLGGAVIAVLLEAFVPRRPRFMVQSVVTALVVAVALIATVMNIQAGNIGTTVAETLVVDKPVWFTWVLLLVFGLLSVLLYAERRVGGGVSAFTPAGSAVPGSMQEREAVAARNEHSEVFPLLLFAIFGMMLFASANDLLTLFVALEIFSLPLYVMAGLGRRRCLLSQEASVKYFLLGALSSGFFIYGVALLYGYSGSFQLSAIDQAITQGRQSEWLLLAGATLIIVGLLFKVGAVPFHSWVPDVYVGSPTPVTAFMAVCTKIAAVLALMRVLYAGLGGLRWDWQVIIAVIAILSMAVGAVMGLTQTDVKRMLAYSSIAHVGFILVGLVGAVTLLSGGEPSEVDSVSSILFYLAAYGFATLGAFAILTLVRRSGGEANAMAAWEGLGRRNPILGVTMTLFLLSMTGIPLTGGFIGKVVVFMAAGRGGYWWLVLIGVLLSLVTAAFYLRLVLVMYFRPAAKDVDIVSASPATWTVIVVGVLGTLILGLVPGPIMDWAVQSAVFLR